MPCTAFTRGKRYKIRAKGIIKSDAYFNSEFRDHNRNHRVDRIIELLGENYTLHEIAAVFCIPYATLYQWMRSNNIMELSAFKKWKNSIPMANERRKREDKRKQPFSKGDWSLQKMPSIIIPKKPKANCGEEFERWKKLALKLNEVRDFVVDSLREKPGTKKNKASVSLSSVISYMKDWEKTKAQADLAWKDYEAAAYVRA